MAVGSKIETLFEHNVAAQKLAEELVKLFSEITYEQFSKLDLNRRRKKARMILDSCEQSREEFMFHFYGDSLSADNPYYKMDALIWKNLFRRKPEDRYLDEVYKFGHYFVRMFEYMNTLSFEDIAHGLIIDWNAGSLYGNYKDFMTSLIPPLSEVQMQEEMQSPYTVKRYEYEYKHPQELTLFNLKRTFANLVAKDKLFGLKLDPGTSSKFDALSSERKLEVIQNVLSALRPVKRMEGYEDEIALSRRNLEYERETTQLDFLTWAQSYFSLLRPQIKEMIERKISIKEMEAQLKQQENISIFEAERVAKVRSGQQFSAETQQELEDIYEKSLKVADTEGNVEVQIKQEPSLSKDRRAAPTFEELVKISEENKKKSKKWRFF